MKTSFVIIKIAILALISNTIFAQKADTTFYDASSNISTKSEATSYRIREKQNDHVIDKIYYLYNNKLIAENEVIIKENEEYVISIKNFDSDNKAMYKEFYSLIINDEKGTKYKPKLDSQHAFAADGSIAQTDVYKDGKKYPRGRIGGGDAALDVDTMAEFPGGEAALMDFLSKNISYPKEAQQNNTTGTVYVEFKVCTDGSLCNYKIVRSISDEIDKEVLRTMKIMPTWKPAMKDGKTVNTYFTLPVSFELED